MHIVTHVHLKFVFKLALYLSTLAIKLFNSYAKIFQTAIATAMLRASFFSMLRHPYMS